MEIIKETKNSIRVRAPAKINLFLEVHRRRPDGYHDIETVMQEISLYDEISFKLADKIIFKQSGIRCPQRGNNIILKTAKLLREFSRLDVGAEIRLKKQIPVSAGLGGGSSDAAAAFMALNKLWGLNLPKRKLVRLSLKIGSDIAFFFTGGTALCTGRGEKVRPIRCRGGMYYVLVCPRQKASTALIYENLRLALTGNLKSAKLIRKFLLEGDLEKIRSSIFNRLAETVFEKYHGLERIYHRISAAGGGEAFITGSGSGIFLLYDNLKEAMRFKRKVGKVTGSVFVVSKHDGHA